MSSHTEVTPEQRDLVLRFLKEGMPRKAPRRLNPRLPFRRHHVAEASPRWVMLVAARRSAA